MTPLSDKEKQVLRLLLRGHDAKSSARELELSVHTVNERLRDARRKLGVSSSREAARMLHESEGDMALGDAPDAPPPASMPSPATRAGGRISRPARSARRWGRCWRGGLPPPTMCLQAPTVW